MERVQRLACPLVVVDVIAGTACVVAVTRARHRTPVVRLVDVATGLNGTKVAADTLTSIFDASGRVSEFLAAQETEVDGHVAGGVVWRVLPEPLKDVRVRTVEDAPLVLPVTRQIVLLGYGHRPDGEVAIRVHGQAVASTTQLGVVASTRHVAVRLWGPGGAVVHLISAKALLGIFEPCDIEAVGDADGDADLGCHGSRGAAGGAGHGSARWVDVAALV